MGAALDTLKAQFDLLEENMPQMIAACSGRKGCLAKVNAQYERARGNYQDALAAAFQENDPQVAAAEKAMQDEQVKLKAALDDLSNMSAVIAVITSAVNAGAGLLGLAG
jgi:hypothetical protein